MPALRTSSIATDASREQARKWNRDNPERRKEINLKHRFGITLAERNAMIMAQGGKCAICHKPVSFAGRGYDKACVDHDHETEAIRGILCARHNLLLSFAEEDIEVLQGAIEYLRKVRSSTSE